MNDKTGDEKGALQNEKPVFFVLCPLLKNFCGAGDVTKKENYAIITKGNPLSSLHHYTTQSSYLFFRVTESFSRFEPSVETAHY
jgi:hypothetical protein